MSGSAFYVFVDDTGDRSKKIRASEVNANFDWLEGNIVPQIAGVKTGSTYNLGHDGSTPLPFKALYLDCEAEHGGAIYFDAGTTSAIKSTADGLTCQFLGFTTVALADTAKVITMLDNNAGALDFKEGSNSYLKFDTTNSAENSLFSKPLYVKLDGSTPALTDYSQTAALFQKTSTGNCRVLVLGKSDSQAIIQMGDESDDDIGAIQYYNSVDAMGLRTNNVSDRILIHSQGIVDMGYQSAVNVYGLTSVIASTAWTQMTLNVEAYDVQNEFSSNTFTATKTGKYSIGLNGGILNATPGTNTRMVFYKNGAAFTMVVEGYEAAGQHNFHSYEELILSAGDTIKLYCQSVTDGTYDAFATVTIHKLS